MITERLIPIELTINEYFDVKIRDKSRTESHIFARGIFIVYTMNIQECTTHYISKYLGLSKSNCKRIYYQFRYLTKEDSRIKRWYDDISRLVLKNNQM